MSSFGNFFYKKVVLQLIVIGTIISYCVIYVSAVATDPIAIEDNKEKTNLSNNIISSPLLKKKKDLMYPISIQLNAQLPFIAFDNVFHINPHLGIGGQIEGNICYFNKAIIKYLDCCPTIGVKVAYHLYKGEYLYGGGLYIEARDDTVKYVPKLGIGLMESNTKKLDDEDVVVRKLHLEITFAYVRYYQLISHWVCHGSIGVQLLSPFIKSEQKDDQSNIHNVDQVRNNYVALAGGIGYVINPYKKHYRTFLPCARKGRVDLFLGGGYDSYIPQDSQQTKSYPIIDGGFTWSCALAKRFAVTLGTEIGYNWCNKNKTKNYRECGGRELKALGGAEMLLGRLIWSVQGVFYLISILPEEQAGNYFKKNVFSKIGVQYRIFNKLFVKINLRSPMKGIALSLLEGKIGLSF